MEWQTINELFTRSRQGDPAATAALIAGFEPLIGRLAQGIACPQDRQDCSQDLRLALLKAIGDYCPERDIPFPAYVRTWLTYMAGKWKSGRYRKYNGGCRRPGQVSLAAPVDGAPTLVMEEVLADPRADVAETVIRRQETARLRALVSGAASPLSSRERQVVYARYVQDKTFRAIEREKGWARDTAKSYERRALAKLRQGMAVWEP